MIFNNYRAMEHLRSLRNDHLTPAHVLELHQLLTEDTLDDPQDAGRFRRSDDVSVVDRRDDKLLHAPPTFAELPERMQRLCDFANADETTMPFVHPVLRAILLHQLETIRRAIAAWHVYVERKSREQQETQRLLNNSPDLRGRFNHRQVALLNHALRHAEATYRVDGHQASHGVVYQTARNDLLQLEALGLLEKIKQGNAFVFYVPINLRERLLPAQWQ